MKSAPRNRIAPAGNVEVPAAGRTLHRLGGRSFIAPADRLVEA